MGSNLLGIDYLRGHIDSSFEDARWMSVEVDGTVERFAIWLLGDDPDGPAALCTVSPPEAAGRKVPAHSHVADQLRLVVEGSFRVGTTWYRAGDMRVQQAGVVYGPEVVGPEGCKQVVMFSTRRGLIMDFPKQKDRETYAELNAQVAEMLASTAVLS